MTDEGPELRGAVFTRDDITIEDTWNVSGLRGTGSHHFHVDDLVVPDMQQVLRLWLDAYPGFTAEVLPLEKQAAVLRRS